MYKVINLNTGAIVMCTHDSSEAQKVTKNLNHALNVVGPMQNRPNINYVCIDTGGSDILHNGEVRIIADYAIPTYQTPT